MPSRKQTRKSLTVKIAFGESVRQQKWRQPTPQEAVFDVGAIRIIHIGEAHRGQPEVSLAAS